MTTITIDELETRVREVFDEVNRGGGPVVVTSDGAVIGEITPGPRMAVGDAESGRRWTQEELDAWWSELKQLQADLAPLWPEGVSALDEVREQRREL